MAGKVYIANFGRENYAWEECKRRSCIATMNWPPEQVFWEANDRDGYIDSRLKRKTWAGIFPTKAVASRWFNLMTIISESVDDIWIHRAADDLWWTVSTAQSPTFETIKEPVGDRGEVVICYKPCQPWSNLSRKGNRLSWGAMHVKALDFLTTESTLQSLSTDYTAYAEALIGGDSLSPWHDRADWQAKQSSRGKSAGKIFSPMEKSIAEMARTAMTTTENANGQIVERILKNKDLRMSQIELEEHIAELINAMSGLCAISGLTLQFLGAETDKNMLASLDRIDSNGHYERGNLQVVCRFLNFWKGARDDQEFKRLIGVLRDA